MTTETTYIDSETKQQFEDILLGYLDAVHGTFIDMEEFNEWKADFGGEALIDYIEALKDDGFKDDGFMDMPPDLFRNIKDNIDALIEDIGSSLFDSFCVDEKEYIFNIEKLAEEDELTKDPYDDPYSVIKG
jgi:hypothetical protein